MIYKTFSKADRASRFAKLVKKFTKFSAYMVEYSQDRYEVRIW